MPATSPSARDGHAMAYDVARQRVVLFGGNSLTSIFSDTWEWDGSNWTLRSPTTSPSERFGHAMAYDVAHQRVVLFGGAGSWPKAYSDTWLYFPVTPATARPIGTACPGTSGPPLLISNDPYLGNPAFILDLLSARPSSVCAFFLADQQQNFPLGGGCTAYVNGTIVTLPVASNAFGFATTQLAVPLDITMRGAQLFGQALVLDPQGPVAGLAFSAGRGFVVGD